MRASSEFKYHLTTRKEEIVLVMIVDQLLDDCQLDTHTKQTDWQPNVYLVHRFVGWLVMILAVIRWRRAAQPVQYCHSRGRD